MINITYSARENGITCEGPHVSSRQVMWLGKVTTLTRDAKRYQA